MYCYFGCNRIAYFFSVETAIRFDVFLDLFVNPIINILLILSLSLLHCKIVKMVVCNLVLNIRFEAFFLTNFLCFFLEPG
jgi:hypothetical protein